MPTRFVLAALAIASGASAASASITTFNDLPSFTTALGATPTYFNDFATVNAGFIVSLQFGPVNGFAYTVDSSNAAGTAVGGNLFNDTGLLSTNRAADAIRFTFTGAPVYAFGGNFWASDELVVAIPGTVTVTLASGTSFSFQTTDSSAYFGVVSDSPITGFRVTGLSSTTVVGWPTADNLTVAGAVPTPGAVALLGLSGLIAARRRRSK